MRYAYRFVKNVSASNNFKNRSTLFIYIRLLLRTLVSFMKQKSICWCREGKREQQLKPIPIKLNDWLFTNILMIINKPTC